MKKVIINQNIQLITSTYIHIVNRTIEAITISNEQLAGGKFDEVVFKNVTFLNCTIQASAFNYTNFIDCEFINCNFSFTKFKNCNLIACVFENCNFCITNSLNSSFQACTFQGNSWKLGAFRDNKLMCCLMDDSTTAHINNNGENISSLSSNVPLNIASEELAMAA
jgi:uncharacterized protein YjbI with pentapeptide repeats